MATNKKQQNIELGNPSEVLAGVLVNFQDSYLEMLDDGLNKDAFRELGKTIRCLSQALADSSFSEIADDDNELELDFEDDDD